MALALLLAWLGCPLLALGLLVFLSGQNPVSTLGLGVLALSTVSLVLAFVVALRDSRG
ncbi:MAG: hypothetical protein ACE5HB_11390 [Terriglobia bacterium]